jgi:hypothetical protein
LLELLFKRLKKPILNDIFVNLLLIFAFFQERIRNMVYKMIERHSKSANGPLHYAPECQMVQYLLPCYVAAYLDLDKDPSVQKESKLKYMHFLHELIGCYEHQEFVQVHTSLQKLTPYIFVAEKEIADDLEFDFQNASIAFKNELENAAIIKQAFTQSFMYLRRAKDQKWLRKLDTFRTTVWAGHLPMHFCRMRHCLINLGWIKVNVYNICLLSAVVCYQIGDVSSKLVFELYKLLKCKREPKAMSDFVMRDYLSEIDVALQRDVALISIRQLTAIIMYLSLFKLKKQDYQYDLFRRMQGPKFIFDTFSAAYWCILENDYWRFKKLLAPCMKAKNSLVDLSMATLKMAKKNRSYTATLKTLTPEGRVQMSKPGELTLFPIQHCRWCGTVHAKIFRLCPECKDNPDYPDINYFCCEKCEVAALDAQHREEHVRDLMIRLNMSTFIY